MGDDVALMIDNENAATTDARVLQAVQDRVQGDYRCDHASELDIHIERNGDDESRLVVGLDGQRVAAEFYRAELRRLHASDKGALQSFADERIFFGTEVALRGAGALAGLADRSHVEK